MNIISEALDFTNTPSGKPTPLNLKPEGIPEYLRSRAQWVCWKYTQKNGRWTKPPFQPNGDYANSTKSETWSDFETALKAYQSGGFDGIGFVFKEGDGLAGIDMDHVLDSSTKKISREEAKEILARFSKLGYIERSPGRDGFRIYVLGKHGRCGKGEGAKDLNWLEAYDYTSPRYLTVTGHRIDAISAHEPGEAQAALDWLHGAFLMKRESVAANDVPPKATATATATAPATTTTTPQVDEELIQRMRSAKNGAKFGALFDLGSAINAGTGELEKPEDASSADASLMAMLAYWCNRDPAQMERIFSRSALGQRDKWTARADYRQRTIQAALDFNLENGSRTAGALGEEPQRDDTPEWVADLNERFSVFLYVSKMTVAFLDHDETAKREVWRFINFESFKQMHCSEYAQCGIDKKGNPIMKSKGKGWLEHPQRTKNRTFYFDPSQPPKLEREGYMNLWVGFAVSGSSEGGSPDLMLKHIQEVVCQNDPEKIRYVMGWLAILIKEPGRRHEVALILRGGKGSGKGTLGNLLCRIFGRHGLAVSMSRHLTGNFNDHLLDCCFLFADEAFFAGDRASEGSLKARITEPLITIEPKGLPVFTATNRLSVLMATNSDYVVPASADERRYAVFDMARDRIGDREYFNNLAQWAQKDANVLALIEYFQAYNLTGFEVRDVPGTRELAEQREYSLPMWAQWWKDALARGSFAGDLVWHESVSNAYLYSSYASYVRYRGANQYDRLGDALLGKEINKHELAPKKKRSREVSGTPKGIVGDWASGETLLYLGVARGQVYIRTLGPLEEARRKFIDAFKLPEDLFEEVDDLPTEGQDPPNVKKKKELDYEALSACFDD